MGRELPLKNALITLWYADGLHGGVKYSAELGSYLHSLGYRVYLCGVLTNNQTREFFAQNHVTLINVADFPMDIEFELVWAHHWPIMAYLIKRNLKYNRLINSSISHFLMIERLLWFHKNVDMCLTLTEQSKLLYTTKYGVPFKKIYVLPNTAPDEYFQYEYHLSAGAPKKVIIVTNHPAPEVKDAMEILRNRGLCVDMFGMATKSVDITPEVLAGYDVVVTIGKTVQYALAMGIAVYNYDFFGGTGYITPQNLDEEQAYNFSGRSHFTKKTAQEIADEIINQFDMIQQYQPVLKSIAQDRYRLSVRINRILKKLYSKRPVRHIKVSKKNKFLFDYAEMVVDMGVMDNAVSRNVSIPDFSIIKPRLRGWSRLWRHIRTGKF